MRISAINAAVMKKLNRRMVLDFIRRKPISRAALSDVTQLTRASITQIVDELMRDGLVVETNVVDRKTPGRRQTQLALVDNAMCVAGMYLSLKDCRLSIVNLGGRVLWRHRMEFNGSSFDDVARSAARLLLEARESLGPVRLDSLGISVPGPTECCPDPNRRWKDFSLNWRDRLIETMRRHLDWELHIGNISNAYALDELYFGMGRDGAENFMVLRVDEGVDAGFILNGRLFVGARGFSPEIGHITMVPGGERCYCGNRGCLERYLSVPGLLKDTPFESWTQVVDALDESEDARRAFDRAAEIIAFETTNLANVLDLEKIAISGALFYGAQRLAEAVNRYRDENFVHRMEKNSVVPAVELNLDRIAAMPAYHSVFAR